MRKPRKRSHSLLQAGENFFVARSRRKFSGDVIRPDIQKYKTDWTAHNQEKRLRPGAIFSRNNRLRSPPLFPFFPSRRRLNPRNAYLDVVIGNKQGTERIEPAAKLVLLFWVTGGVQQTFVAFKLGAHPMMPDFLLPMHSRGGSGKSKLNSTKACSKPPELPRIRLGRTIIICNCTSRMGFP